MLANKLAYAYAPLLTVVLLLSPSAAAATLPDPDTEALRQRIEGLLFGGLPNPLDPVPAADPCSPGVGCFPIYVDEQGDTMSGILRMLNTDIEILDEGQLRFDQGSFLSKDKGQIRFPLYFGLTAPALESQGFDPANASALADAIADDPGVYILDDGVIHFSDGSQMTPGGSFINHSLVFNNTVTIQGAGNQLFITDGADLIFSGLGGLLTSQGVGRIGTLDFNAFRIIVNNETAMLFEPGSTPNIIGGHNLNNATMGLIGVVIAGGGNATLPNLATENFTSILGGLGNSASGLYAIVIGGFDNEAAGQYSAAGGRQAGALHDGSFVWADSLDVDFDSTDNDQFLIRAAGGVGMGTNAPVSALTVKGDITPATDDTYALGSATNRWDTLYMASEIDYANDLIYTSGAMTRATLTTAGDFTVTGILAADSFVGDGSGLTGVSATSANTLDGLDSTQFIRSDASDSVTAGTFTIGSGAKIAIIGPLASDIIPDLNGAYTIGDATHRFTDLWLSSVIHYTDILEFESGGAIHATLDDGGNLTVLGTMNAASFAGDGSGLTGVVATPAADSVDGASIVDGSIGIADLAAFCAEGNILERGASAWTCGTDDDTTYAPGPGLTLAGSVFSIPTGGLNSAMIADGVVTGADVAFDTLTAADIAAGGVGSSEIADGSVASIDIAADTITAADIATDAVGALEIAPGAVGTSEIADGSIVAADVDTASIQRRVTGTCATGQSIRVIAVDGTVTCEADDGAIYSAGSGLLLTGTVFSINADGIVTGMIAPDAVTAADIAAGAVASSEVADGSIGHVDVNTTQIQRRVSGTCSVNQAISSIAADGSVTCETDDSTAYTAGSGLVLTGTVFSIDANGVVTGMVAPDTLTAADIAADAIGASELGPNAVDGSNVVDNSLTQSDLATGSVASAEIFDGSVTGTDIATDTITAADIAAGGVGSSEIADGSIAAADVNSGAIQLRVTGTCAVGNSIRAIASDGTVTCEADDNTPYSAGAGLALTGTTFSVAADGIVSSMVAPNTLTGLDIADDSIASGELALNAVDGSNVLDNSLSADDLAAGSVTTSEILDGTIASIDIATDTIAAVDIAAGAVTSSEIADGTIVAADINTGSVQQRVSGTCTAGNAIRVIASDGTVTCQSVGAADTLDGLDSTQFLRSDTSDSFTSGTLTIGSGTDLSLVGTVTGDVIPTTNTTYALGDNTHRYTDLWLGSDINYVTDLEFIDGDKEVTMKLVGNNLWVRDLLEASEVDAGFIRSNQGIFVSEDLQVGALSPGDDDSIFFDDGVSEYVRWANAAGRFELSDDTFVQGQVRLDAGTGNAVLSYGNTGLTGQASGWDPNPAATKQGVFIEGGSEESAGIYLDGDMAVIWSPGDLDLLRVYDEDLLPGGAAAFAVDPSGDIRVGDDSTSNDDSVFFDQASAEYLRWANAAGRFELSDDLAVTGEITQEGSAVCDMSGNCPGAGGSLGGLRILNFFDVDVGREALRQRAAGVSVCYRDVNVNGLPDSTEPFYVDMNNDLCGSVSAGDFRLDGNLGFAAFSRVASGNNDVGLSITSAGAAGMVDGQPGVKYYDANGNSARDIDEPLYLDNDNDGVVESGDLRWTATGPFAAGTHVTGASSDAGRPVAAIPGATDLDQIMSWFDASNDGLWDPTYVLEKVYLDLDQDDRMSRGDYRIDSIASLV